MIYGATTIPKDFFNRSDFFYKNKKIRKLIFDWLWIAEKCRLPFGFVHEFDDGMRN